MLSKIETNTRSAQKLSLDESFSFPSGSTTTLQSMLNTSLNLRNDFLGTVSSLESLAPLSREIFATLCWEYGCLAALSTADTKHSESLPSTAALTLLDSLDYFRFSQRQPLSADEVRGICFLALEDNIGTDSVEQLSALHPTMGLEIKRECKTYTQVYTPSDTLAQKLQNESLAVVFRNNYTWNAFNNMYEFSGDSQSALSPSMYQLTKALRKLEVEGSFVAAKIEYLRPTGKYERIDMYCGRMPFSKKSQYVVHTLNQIEERVERDLTGASITIHGRLDPNFITELTTVDKNGVFPFPHVELIYSLLLPSGKTYEFVIKAATDFSLKERNNYTTYSSEDLSLIQKLEEYFRHRDILHPDDNYRRALGLFGTLIPDHFPDFLKRTIESFYSFELPTEPIQLLVDPMTLQSLHTINTYETARVKSIWQRLEQLEGDNFDLIHDYAHKGLYEIKEVFLQAVRNAIPRLASYDYIKSRKDIPTDPEWIEDFVSVYGDELYSLAMRERQAIVNEHNSDMAVERFAKGYIGPPELYALPLEHLIFDYICNKETHDTGAGRTISYTDRKDIYSLEDIASALPNFDTGRVVQAFVHHPLTNSTRVVDGIAAVKRLPKEIFKETLRILDETPPSEPIHSFQSSDIVDGIIDLFDTKKLELSKELTAMGVRRSNVMREVAKLHRTLKSSQAERRKAILIARKPLDEEEQVLKRNGLALEQNVQMLIRDLFPSYARDHLPTLLRIEDVHTLRFIYTIDRQEAVAISPEITTEGLIRRRSHPECAQGGSVSAAGELVFRQHQFRTSNYFTWLDFDQDLSAGNSSWELIELNNATGHYQIPPAVLPYARRIILPILKKQGIGTSHTKVIDRLTPGLQMRGTGTYWY